MMNNNTAGYYLEVSLTINPLVCEFSIIGGNSWCGTSSRECQRSFDAQSTTNNDQ
jgi:hypothetical protein